MAKVLIFNGAVRKNGDTEILVNYLCEQLKGHEVNIVRSHGDISPCVDCRWCWKNPSCAIKDGMQEVYRQIDEADWIILASPVHFEELSGSLLQLLSRLQVYCMARMMRKEELMSDKCRKAAVLLAAGGPGKALEAQTSAKRLLHCMHAFDEIIIHCKNTDRKPVLENEPVLEQLRQLAALINGEG